MTTAARPDAKKTLTQLRAQWESCTACDLGVRRAAVGGAFVFGRGTTHSIMLIGEGPGVEEEREGAPFVGKSGQFLTNVLTALGMREYYLTNLVTCRSCVPSLDGDGNPVFRKNYQTKLPEQMFKDEPPTPPQYLACLPRLHEEIYLVDPVLIVGLGGKACEALLGRPITITRDRGEATHIKVPGHGYRAVLTDKKKEWSHRVRGEVVQEVEQNDVLYHFVPTLHPAYVLRTVRADQGPDSPFRKFIQDLRKALRIYDGYLELAFGVVPTQTDVNEEELHAAFNQQGEEE